MVFLNHLLKISDLSSAELFDILELAAKLKAKQKMGQEHHLLRGKTLAMIFSKSSTRTRISFEVGMHQLGGQAIYLNSQDIQLGRGETIYDTANTMTRFVDGIMIRTFNHQDVIDFAKFGDVPVINGLTDLHHPCQALADLLTLSEIYGNLKDVKLAYVGDGNNVANSLMEACSLAGMTFSVATPPGYECAPEVIDTVKIIAKKTGAQINICNDAKEAVADSDAIYTDTWTSMGQEDEKQKRKEIFKEYQVNDELFGYAKSSAVFMHCLPAYRELEVTKRVIDGVRSKVFDQAENRLHAQKAVMCKLMCK